MRTALVPAVVALCLSLSGCQGCGTSVKASQGHSAPATAHEPSARSSGAGATHANKSPPGPPPEVSVTAEPTELGEADRRVPVVQVHGSRPAHLAREVEVQRREGTAWHRVATVTLRPSCDAAPPADRCVTLIAGAELRPPPWLGTTGSGQCACREGCKPAPAGTYRFVVRTCDGAHEIAGAPFGLSR